jgi:hypothetical protein
MNQIRSLDLFTAREHVNTLAVRVSRPTVAALVSPFRDNARAKPSIPNLGGAGGGGGVGGRSLAV